MCSILLALCAWKLEKRRWARWMALGVLGAVIFQGILGGLRVVLVKLDLAVVHACIAQAFFCYAAAMAVVTSKWWFGNATGVAQVSEPAVDGRDARGTFAIAVVAVLLIYLQLGVGALMRHYQAGLAIPDFPASYGRVLPPTNAAELHAANAHRTFDLNLPQVTLSQIWLHFGHRLGALFVTIALLALIIRILIARPPAALVRPALLLIPLLIAQITLGILTVLWRKPADIASFHVAIGALTLVTTFAIAMRDGRIRARENELRPAIVRQRLQIDIPKRQRSIAKVSPA